MNDFPKRPRTGPFTEGRCLYSVHQHGLWRYGWWIGAALLWLLIAPGCEKPVRRADPAPPGVTYTGPAFLRGTVGSLTQLRGTGAMLVSGYGLVVNLDDTGSSDVPAFLRQWLINEMRKRGVGSTRLGADWMSPEAVLASPKTAVVQVEGLVPAGTVKGTRFDVLVSALPQTQTTSLEGGQLWTVDLSQGGANTSLAFSRRLARARGPLYINPFAESTAGASPAAGTSPGAGASPGAAVSSGAGGDGGALKRQGVVLAGGVTTEARKMELILNQASWQRSRLVADRINERYPRAPADRLDTAIAIDDTRIDLNVPKRYQQRVDEFLSLIGHLYTQRGTGFEAAQAQRLADVLVADPTLASDVGWAWQSLGKTIFPVLSQYYDHAHPMVSLTALEAGARLGHELATEHLSELAARSDPALRRRVAEILAHLPGSLRGSRTLQRLLDDPVTAVRVAAYESLATMNDPVLGRVPVESDGELKFVLDLVPARQPLVYIAHANVPRIALFNPRLAVRTPSLFRYWDNRLMIRAQDAGGKLAVFHQPSGQVDGKTYDVRQNVADLVNFLAHRPTVENPQPGLDLSFSQVAAVLNELCRQKIIDAELQLQSNPLATAIAEAQARESTPRRPESSPSPPPPHPDRAGGNQNPDAGPKGVENNTSGSGRDAQPEAQPPLPLP